MALLAVMCWSTIGSAFKITLRYLDFLHILLYASFVSLLVFFTILTVKGKLSLLTKLTRKDLLRSALLGLLNPFLFYVTVLKAYDLPDMVASLAPRQVTVVDAADPLGNPLTVEEMRNVYGSSARLEHRREPVR